MTSSTVRGSRNAGIIDNGLGSLNINGSSIDGSGEVGFRTRIGANGSAISFPQLSMEMTLQQQLGSLNNPASRVFRCRVTQLFQWEYSPVVYSLPDDSSISNGNLITNAEDGVAVTGNGQFSMTTGP